MSVEANKAVARRFIEEYQTNGREEIADELLADNFFDHSALPGFSPDREGVKQLFKMPHGAFDGFRAGILNKLPKMIKL